YEIVAGERRWRAAQRAGLDTVPALVRELDDRQAIAIALIENIQREDLNPLEEAAALKRLLAEHDMTHEQVADAVGRSRTAVSNLLRLLNLAPGVREMIDSGELEMGHARALLALPTDEQAAAGREVAKRSLSVRQTEALVKRLLSGSPPEPVPDPDTRRLERSASEHLGAPVSITSNSKGKGRVVIRYSSLDELDGILARMGTKLER
ncbi:MAG: ParB/RepB/Spo0J family partition protein, partial [Gammaproteobacteria bacterium]|nr:ParB/RepB/Spo0J family partition protein [Gammaproteobacteria bacterium]